MNFTFQKYLRILKRRHYKWMCFGSKRLAGNFLILDIKKNFTEFSRLGITVTKKFGRAHQRNRIKRLIRETFRCHRHLLQNGIDIHVRPLLSAREAKLQDIIQDMLQLIGNHESL